MYIMQVMPRGAMNGRKILMLVTELHEARE
jgi:hypothetical protein